MPRIPAFIQHRGIEATAQGLEKAWQALRQAYERAAVIINGNISFGDGSNPDNIAGVWASVPDTGASDTDFTVVHNLGRLPVGYILMQTDVATLIYTGSVVATTTEITLRSATANASIVLFIV